MEKIPKIIHQIWIGPKKRPDIWIKTWSEDYINKFKDFGLSIDAAMIDIKEAH